MGNSNNLQFVSRRSFKPSYGSSSRISFTFLLLSLVLLLSPSITNLHLSNETFLLSSCLLPHGPHLFLSLFILFFLFFPVLLLLVATSIIPLLIIKKKQGIRWKVKKRRMPKAVVIRRESKYKKGRRGYLNSTYEFASSTCKFANYAKCIKQSSPCGRTLFAIAHLWGPLVRITTLVVFFFILLQILL